MGLNLAVASSDSIRVFLFHHVFSLLKNLALASGYSWSNTPFSLSYLCFLSLMFPLSAYIISSIQRGLRLFPEQVSRQREMLTAAKRGKGICMHPNQRYTHHLSSRLTSDSAGRVAFHSLAGLYLRILVSLLPHSWNLKMC
jgi:hypothetical protein